MEVQTHTEPWDLNTMICFVAYRLRQECNQRLAEYGLTYAQARILNHLHMAQDDTVVNQHNLVCSLGVKASSISAVLRNMEHKGLIKKCGCKVIIGIKRYSSHRLEIACTQPFTPC